MGPSIRSGWGVAGRRRTTYRLQTLPRPGPRLLDVGSHCSEGGLLLLPSPTAGPASSLGWTGRGIVTRPGARSGWWANPPPLGTTPRSGHPRASEAGTFAGSVGRTKRLSQSTSWVGGPASETRCLGFDLRGRERGAEPEKREQRGRPRRRRCPLRALRRRLLSDHRGPRLGGSVAPKASVPEIAAPGPSAPPPSLERSPPARSPRSPSPASSGGSPALAAARRSAK